ncbi:hypothetical protein Ga0123461_0834 [Mariprofundus aestuarium]|uniref:DUF4198 domain-containing protein n=1 Tax=Mariprofundus aestuarium TaxID=1921086 RepID=A0A2K8L2S2_MARES|nr:hypothetical protein [Mariprofundus aestuarium]ATX79254.1 hypothetical protein Ga0123461_0834 [Mariprofundus aestuarium]
MKIKALMGATLVVVLFSFNAQAAMYWSPAPMKHGHSGHDRHAGKPFLLHAGEGAEAQLMSPSKAVKPLTLEYGRVSVKAMGTGNYHALVAKRSVDDLHESAVRYIYMHGKPSGVSPSLLIGHEKSALEIEPAPLAREHWRYYSNTNAQFIVRFQGQPLAGAKLSMLTGNGSSAEFTTDAEGLVVIPLPEDFVYEKPGRMANPASEFVLTAEHSVGSQKYITTFSYSYHINPEHWQSTELGLAVIGGGMLIGGFVTLRKRRRREKK